MNIIVYNSGILKDESFNMFYISPYFTSTLPVFDIIQESVPYPLYLITYLCVLITGALIIYFSSLGIKELCETYKNKIVKLNIIK